MPGTMNTANLPEQATAIMSVMLRVLNTYYAIIVFRNKLKTDGALKKNHIARIVSQTAQPADEEGLK